MITQKDIALEAGVSVMTVSNVINQKYSNVSKETIDKVNKIIKKYNYSPNQYAQNLSKKNSNTVVIFAPYFTDEPYNIFLDPYNQNMIGYMEMFLREKGYAVILQLCATPQAVIKSLHSWNVSGAIFFYPYFTPEQMQQIIDVGIPIVVMDRFYKDLDVLTVDLQDKYGSYMATKFLLSHGHRKIAFAFAGKRTTLSSEDLLSGYGSEVVYYRLLGYEQALKEHGIPVNEDWLFGNTDDFETGIDVGKRIMQMSGDRPTAIYCMLDRAAIGVAEGIRLSGKKVPNDFSIVGFDGIPNLQYYIPKITTIHQDFKEKSFQIVNLLLKKLTGEEIENKHITLDVKLIERQSVLDISL